MAETLAQKVARLTAESVELAPPDPAWPALFATEAANLRRILPPDLLGRIEHFGSTAVPGLWAKPIIDMLVETPDLERARAEIPPIVEPLGYDHIWRPTWGDDTPPWYLWLIRRGQGGRRTHHIHIVEPDFAHWQRLAFRDRLRANPAEAAAYGALKRRLAREHASDRVAYTRAKGQFIAEIMRKIQAGG